VRLNKCSALLFKVSPPSHNKRHCYYEIFRCDTKLYQHESQCSMLVRVLVGPAVNRRMTQTTVSKHWRKIDPKH